MISEIKIDGIATYKKETMMTPTEINYVYGCNGSGKTTLSNLIRTPEKYNTCSLKWEDNKLETLVYNRDFIKENFSQSSAIKGIFTLGKDAKDTKEIIDKLKKEIGDLDDKIKGFNKTLSKKEEEIKIETNDIIEKCWKVKQKYGDEFKEAFRGYNGSKKKFFEKCISEEKNSSELLTEDEINKKCKQIFSESLRTYDEFKVMNYSELYELEKANILKERIIGKEDVPIGKLINKLNNSDWIKQGIQFLNTSGDVCPFCQRKMNIDFKKEIESFFDETYELKCKELRKFRDQYIRYIDFQIRYIEEVMETNIDFINYEIIDKELELIRQKKSANIELIDKKIQSPSITIEIESIIGNLDRVKLLMDGYIEQIKTNNRIAEHIDKEKEQLSNEIWKYSYNELQSDISRYTKKKKGIDKAADSIKSSLKLGENKRDELQIEINSKESEVTNIKHTVSEINRVLNLFGFNNFKLSQSKHKGYYRIIRPNGDDVNETLSEGEYTFITLLYFYQLVKGSIEKTGVLKDKIVVIDDPISSLDSNVLFIVSNLVKNIIKSCNEGKNGIKQVFVLTHNVYFHKEVTFKGGRESNTKKESFWIIRKLDGISKICKYDSNPIQTTYELLWRELEDPQKINTATVFNTMRRILEYYFNILGGKKYEECIDKFEGEEKLICKTLISWINDGSHFIGDDLEVPIEQDEIQKYLNVFRLIFDKMGQIDHYNMMMKIE